MLQEGWDIGQPALNILNACCAKGGVSGQESIEDLGYTVVVAYANCRHGENDDCPSMGPKSDPWGPNGACR